jgi:hypothetical protein
MFFHFGTPYRLDSIRRGVTPNDENRKTFPILVIDDEPFTQQKHLEMHGYSLTYFEDIQTIDVASKYPIIICDIKGVGKKLGSKNEGAHLLAEIRQKFPDKYLISHTGLTTEPRYNKDLRSADIVVSKDKSIDDWVEMLDRAFRIMADPTQRWARIRERLISNGEDLFEIFRLEQAYIESVIKGDPSIFSRKKSQLRLHDDSGVLMAAFAKEALPAVIRGLIKVVSDD